MVTVWAYLVFLALLGLERGVELVISRRNARWALAHGGREYGRAHFRWMALLHTLFLFSCGAETLWASRPFHPPLGISMLVLALLAQAMRYWVIATLGRYWNVRVIVIPDAPVRTGGPYRHLRHPNYLAVIIEGLAIPLIHTAWLTAAAFTLLNAWLLVVRIRCEERALSNHCGYQRSLGNRPRLMPGRSSRGPDNWPCEEPTRQP